MGKPVKYRPPRRINIVSIGFIAALGVGVYLAYQYIPLLLLKSEAYRVLEERGSQLAGRRSAFLENPAQLEELKRQMLADLRAAGVDDPGAEVWIEPEGSSVRFGVIYSKWIEWPYDIIERQESVYEIEHIAKVR